MNDSSTLILIPSYNGIKTLPSLLAQLKDLDYCNMHIVDDGSDDGTSQFLINSEFSWSSHQKNLGKGAAIQTGARWAIDHQYKWILTIDADLQHSPLFIPRLLEIKEKNTLVLGARRNLSSMPKKRQFSNKFSSLLLSIRSNYLLKDSQCGFRLIPSKLFNELEFSYDGFQFESEILIRAIMARYIIAHVEIPTIYSNEKSAMRNFKDTSKFVAMYFHSFFW